MDTITSQIIHQVWAQVYSPEGFPFPYTVAALSKLKVQRYHVDYVAHTITAYVGAHSDTAPMPQHDENPSSTAAASSANWDADAIVAAIRKTQAGVGNYHDFSNEMVAAGVTNYFAYLEGRKVVYIGALGDTHVEHFPSAPP